MQLFLFGYAVNTNPKRLPTWPALPSTRNMSARSSPPSRTPATATCPRRPPPRRLSRQATCFFVINFPPNFDRSVDRGEAPQVLVDADATYPSAISNATAALAAIGNALDRDLPPVRRPQAPGPPYQFHVRSPSGSSTFVDFSSMADATPPAGAISVIVTSIAAASILRDMTFSCDGCDVDRLDDVAYGAGRVPIGRGRLGLAVGVDAADHYGVRNVPRRWPTSSISRFRR
jgi:hypothetical protein